MRLAFRAKIVKAKKCMTKTYTRFCRLVKEGKSQSYITHRLQYLRIYEYIQYYIGTFSNGNLQYDSLHTL